MKPRCRCFDLAADCTYRLVVHGPGGRSWTIEPEPETPMPLLLTRKARKEHAYEQARHLAATMMTQRGFGDVGGTKTPHDPTTAVALVHRVTTAQIDARLPKGAIFGDGSKIKELWDHFVQWCKDHQDQIIMVAKIILALVMLFADNPPAQARSPKLKPRKKR